MPLCFARPSRPTWKGPRGQRARGDRACAGGGGEIRTLGTRSAQRFSRPPHSTALPPLRGAHHSSAWGHGGTVACRCESRGRRICLHPSGAATGFRERGCTCRRQMTAADSVLRELQGSVLLRSGWHAIVARPLSGGAYVNPRLRGSMAGGLQVDSGVLDPAAGPWTFSPTVGTRKTESSAAPKAAVRHLVRRETLHASDASATAFGTHAARRLRWWTARHDLRRHYGRPDTGARGCACAPRRG